MLAAATGMVRGCATAGKMLSVRIAGEGSVKGRECGNGVVLAHPGGWETQYCHMAKGSVRVKTGETVTAGTVLGLVGMSGDAEFPHLHLAVRHNGEKIDPFAPDAKLGCLWRRTEAVVEGCRGRAGVSFARRRQWDLPPQRSLWTM